MRVTLRVPAGLPESQRTEALGARRAGGHRGPRVIEVSGVQMAVNGG